MRFQGVGGGARPMLKSKGHANVPCMQLYVKGEEKLLAWPTFCVCELAQALIGASSTFLSMPCDSSGPLCVQAEYLGKMFHLPNIDNYFIINVRRGNGYSLTKVHPELSTSWH